MKKILIAFILVLVLFSQMVFASTPTITNVTGTVATGQTLTITGTNMMELVTTNWRNTANEASFENDTDFTASNFNDDGWYWNTGNSADSKGEYKQDYKIHGNNSAYLLNDWCSCEGACTSCCGNRLTTYEGNGTEYYVAGYFRYTGERPSGYMKFFEAQAGGGNQYFQPTGGSSSTITQWILRDNAGSDVYSYLSCPTITFGQWNHFEVHWKVTSPRVMQAWINGVSLGSITPTHSNSSSWQEIGIPNLCGLTSPEWVGINMDLIAFSNARIYPASKIEISNHLTYGSGTVNWQVPVLISDTSIQITANLTNLGAGPYYLWVTNNGQTRSASYNLSGGADTDPPTISEATPSTEQSCPASPTSVTIGVYTNETATCKYGTSDVAYASLPNTFTTTGGLIHSSNLSLACDASYTYYVRCIDGSGNANTSSTEISFDVASANPPPPPSAPTLSSPSDAASNQTIPVTLAWNAAETADSYTLQVSTVSNFATTIFNESLILTTSKAVPSLLNSTIYYWRVKATNAGGDSSWSSTRSFTTIPASARTVYWTESFETSDAGARGWENDETWPITSSGCYSGNCLQIAFANAATTPTSLSPSTFKHIVEGGTESLYVKFYQKLATNWVGSNYSYHPHFIMIPSNLDWDSDPYHGPMLSYHELYIEPGNSTDGRSPTFAIQDGEQINTSYSQIPNNLTATTESRDVGGCNGCLSGSTCGNSTVCYDCGDGDWCNGRTWRNDTDKFTLNTWQKVEVYFGMNTITSGTANADGIMWMKVDDVTIMSYTNVVYRTGANPTMNWEEFIIAPYIGEGSPQAQTMYMDELEVADYPEYSGMPVYPSVKGCTINMGASVK